MTKFKPLAAAALLAIMMGSTPAMADTAIVSFTPGTLFSSATDNQTVGWSFSVAAGSGVTVNALGWWDHNQDGLGGAHEVGIWNTAGSLLGSATVAAGTVAPLTGSFRYADVTPFALTGGETYIIGGFDSQADSDSYITGVGGLTMGSQISFLQAARSGTDTGFVVPTTFANNSGGRFGPNFQFTATPVTPVPEPGTYAMMALGLMAVGVAARRRAA